jgi:hypothetical protein
MKHKRSDAAGSELWGSVILLVIVLAITGAIAVYKAAIPGGESEGTVKYEDCRQIIAIKQGDWVANFKSFVCDMRRTTNGKVMAGFCVHVDTTPDGKCERAYTYHKIPEVACSAEYPYLGTDGKCHRTFEEGMINSYSK